MESESDQRRPDGPPEDATHANDAAGTRGPHEIRESSREPIGPRAEVDDEAGAIPDMVRKALSMGLAGFFSTEQTIRKALGDTLPKEWIDFMSDQSERTRGDLTEAIASEVGRSLKSIDLTQVADQLLTGRTLEVSARIRLLPPDEQEGGPEEGDT